jgi:nucleotide-binding universal stress UspA family protein
MQAELILLRVIQPLVLGQPSLGEWAPAAMDRTLLEKLETLDKEKRDEAGSHLDKIAAGLRSSSLSVRTYLVTHDQPAAAILNEVRTQGVDLIALETHGRGGFARFFLGSVADKVIRGASIPVLVHRPRTESP